MTVNPYGVIKGFNIFKDKPVSMFLIPDIKTVKPFSFDQGMERLDTGIIVRITAMGIAALHLFRGFPPRSGNILAAAV